MNSLRNMRIPQASSMVGGFKPTFSLKIVGIFLLAVVLAIIAYYIYQNSYPSASKNASVYNPNQGGQGSGKEAELILFYADWCPHCKTAKPEWEQVKAEYNGKDVNGYSLIFTDVNCTNESADVEKMMNTYKIEGFPTIKLVKDNQIIDFDAKPTKSTLTQFINTVV
jgi:thiol-disulfide isomerase/thioredoxin